MTIAAQPADSAKTIEFADPHIQSGPAEAEVTRVRALTGVWRWLLVAASALTIFLCINQQFTLRFFVGFTQLNTEYYYLLIVCMLPFTFLIFPGSARAPLEAQNMLFAARSEMQAQYLAQIEKELPYPKQKMTLLSGEIKGIGRLRSYISLCRHSGRERRPRYESCWHRTCRG